MRRFSEKEKKLINDLIEYSDAPCFPVFPYVAKQRIFTPKDLLEIAFLLWFLEDNGYVYLSQSTAFTDDSKDINVNKALNQLYDSLHGRVDELLRKDIFVTDQLRNLQGVNFQSIEEEQLTYTKQILNNALAQTYEAKNQTKEALNQTAEAEKQTKEALKQTNEALKQTGEAIKQVKESKQQTGFALATFFLSLLTFIISLIVSNRSCEKLSGDNAMKNESLVLNQDTTDSFSPKDTRNDSEQIAIPIDSIDVLSQIDSVFSGGAKLDR